VKLKPYFCRQLVLLLLTGIAGAADYHPPGGTSYVRTTGDLTILPGGRALKPMGSQIEVGPGAFGLAISPKGLIAVANTGFERYGISVLEPRKDTWREQQIWAVSPEATAARFLAKEGDSLWQGVSYGIAFDSEKAVWVTEGDSGKIRLVDVSNASRKKLITINSGEWHNSYTADLAFDSARHLLFVVDQANFRVAIVDSLKGEVVSSVKTGRMPFAIALSPDRNTAYVTNAGMFQYQVLPGVIKEDPIRTGLPFPAFGFPSPESQSGSGRAQALGDPNVPESNSVAVINVQDPLKPSVEEWIRTGPPFGGDVNNGSALPKGRAQGGSAPAAILTVEDKVYVSNAHSDTISVISATDRKLIGEIPIRVPWMLPLRGFMPCGMAYDPVTKWLLVAEAGINAVGVIDTARNVVIAHLPVGLFPTRVGLADGRVWVVNARGRGTGPNARRPVEEFLGETPPALHVGTLSTFIMPAANDLQKLTSTAFAANGFFLDNAATPALPPEIRHVVLIVKENRTFDEVLGDVGDAANGKVWANPAIARYGMHGRADGGGVRFSVKEAAITPNQHAIAERFSFSDNFYSDGDTDVDGHHWLTGVIPDLLTTSGLFASYGGQKRFSLDSSTPGRLLFAQASASTHPEEIPENGTLWHHLERNGISFRNFGEGMELAGVVEGGRDASGDTVPNGASYLTNMPMPDALYRNTSRDYPGFTLDISDQTRADRFIAEIDERYKSGKEELPQFIYVTLPNDHTGDERPREGYPYTASWVADNDFALGRIVEYLSHTPWWREMAVFITEDDASGGADAVDSHRTVFLAAGPYIRRGYASHINSSIPGLLKTIFELLHIPALQLSDATAASIRDIFTSEPDYSPYGVIPPDKRIFDPAAFGRKAEAEAKQP
jgi:DNA-binding beta-propeller fold protein YncE